MVTPFFVYYQTPYGLPPMNAVKTILPHFHSLYNAGPTSEPVKEYVPLANLSSPNVSTPPERGWVYFIIQAVKMKYESNI